MKERFITEHIVDEDHNYIKVSYMCECGNVLMEARMTLDEKHKGTLGPFISKKYKYCPYCGTEQKNIPGISEMLDVVKEEVEKIKTEARDEELFHTACMIDGYLKTNREKIEPAIQQFMYIAIRELVNNISPVYKEKKEDYLRVLICTEEAWQRFNTDSIKRIKIETLNEGYVLEANSYMELLNIVTNEIDDSVEEVIIKKRTAKQSPNLDSKDVPSKTMTCI